METAAILQALPSLTIDQRLAIAEAALRLVNEEPHLTREQRRQQMAIAAMSAMADYVPGTELTAFTVLDGEGFYEETIADSDNAHA
jgi:hypothetical protein